MFSTFFGSIAAFGLAAAGWAGVGVGSADTVIVTPDNMQNWVFYNDENDTVDASLGSFVAGPGTPPLGSDSVQITVTSTQRRNLATYQFAGTPLADITEWKFSTYNASAGNGGSATRSAYLQFNVDFDGSDTWQRRLAFIPSKNGTVQQDNWQEWDAIGDGSALWWWSGFAANGNKWPDGNTTEYRTWDDLLAAFPDSAIRTTDAFVGLRVGEPYADGYTENIDKFIFATDEQRTVFDFETKAPATKDECKKDGWKGFGGKYKNQDECEKFAGKHNKTFKWGKGNDKGGKGGKNKNNNGKGGKSNNFSWNKKQFDNDKKGGFGRWGDWKH